MKLLLISSTCLKCNLLLHVGIRWLILGRENHQAVLIRKQRSGIRVKLSFFLFTVMEHLLWNAWIAYMFLIFSPVSDECYNHFVSAETLKLSHHKRARALNSVCLLVLKSRKPQVRKTVLGSRSLKMPQEENNLPVTLIFTTTWGLNTQFNYVGFHRWHRAFDLNLITLQICGY